MRMPYTFTDLSAWGNYFYPTGIDNQDNITGFNPNNLNVYPHQPYLGFMLNGPTLTTYAYYNPPAIAVPNDPLAALDSTFAMGINNSGEIVGYYFDKTKPAYDAAAHGFIYQNGTFTTVDGPGAVNTYLSAINNNGEIVGYYSTPDKNAFPFPYDTHGLVYDHGTMTTLDNSDNTNTIFTGINDAGVIVGYDSYDLSPPLGFVVSPDGALPMAPLAYTPDVASLRVWEAEAAGGGGPYSTLVISSSQLQTLIDFSNSQHAYGQQIGVDPALYVYETLGAALSSEPNFLYLANIADDTAFVTAAYQSAFRQAGNSDQIQSFVGQLHFLEAFYKDAHLPHYELIAKGATFGLMLGVEAEMTQVPIVGTTPHITGA
jgi:hypothetical protein